MLWTPELGWLVVVHQRNELSKGVTEAVGVQGRWNLLSEGQFPAGAGYCHTGQTTQVNVPCSLNEGPARFVRKGQEGQYYRFAGQVVFVATARLCSCSPKVAINDRYTNEHGYGYRH